MKKLTALFAISALVLAPVALSACGDDDEDTTAASTTEETTADTGGGETVTVSAAEDGSFAFDQDSLEAKAGQATFEFDNPASLGHDFCLEDPNGEDVGCTDVVTGDTTTLDADLEAGEYTYYCDVDGHREGGMEGTLTVN